MDGTAATSSPPDVPGLAIAVSSQIRWTQSHVSARAHRPPSGRGGAWGNAGLRTSNDLDMEWHMKRLRQRCCVSLSALENPASFTLRLQREPLKILLWRDDLLLWRDHQWPSKR
jgi:hypothetical protein